MSRQRKRKGDPVHGWLNFEKPVGMTSTQAVAIIKRLLNAEKAGHGGTLDPLADGILPIALGEATKTVPWTMDSDKDYAFTIRWGISTASQDGEGAVTAQSDARPSRQAIVEALPSFCGLIQQVPPKFSAVKVAGERAYDLAREGETFELEAREVRLDQISLAGVPDADHAAIHVTSGKGFYVRSLARDLAAMLGCEGHISQLRRTRVGVFEDKAAVRLEELQALEGDFAALRARLMPLQSVLTDMPHLEISARDAGDIRQGRSVMLMPHVAEKFRAERREDDRRAVAIDAGHAIALGEVRAGQFEPGRVFQL